MPGTINQYQQTAFSTPINGAVADATVVLGNDNAVRTKHNSHDADATIHLQSSILSSRPGASIAQRVWLTTDERRIYVDSGTAWSEVAYLSTAGGTVTGAVAFSAGITGTTLAFTGAVTLSSSVTLSNGLTVSSGSTAVQDLTATQGTFTAPTTVSVSGHTVELTGTTAAGALVQGGWVTGVTDGLNITPNNDNVSGKKLVLGYFTGAVYESALEYANVSSGHATVSILKSGGILDLSVPTLSFPSGTYVATVTPSTSGSVTLNSSNDTLQWKKVGPLVHVQGELIVSGVSAPVGIIQINLPFATSAGTKTSGTGAGGGCAINSAISAWTGAPVALFSASSSVLQIFEYAAGSLSSPANRLQIGTQIIVNLWYEAAS